MSLSKVSRYAFYKFRLFLASNPSPILPSFSYSLNLRFYVHSNPNNFDDAVASFMGGYRLDVIGVSLVHFPLLQRRFHLLQRKFRLLLLEMKDKLEEPWKIFALPTYKTGSDSESDSEYAPAKEVANPIVKPHISSKLMEETHKMQPSTTLAKSVMKRLSEKNQVVSEPKRTKNASRDDEIRATENVRKCRY
ncbi:pentatricopeptide repeat-containing protein [Senna tora]|uniref:Pentatricopeptide repeat-containing protein n=1 Tax=Senna tora TaxID=362788 RepID=A0A834T1B8_9FABA|nr:pentatricopeptide repeat-containing protein [Senna tora]